MGSKLLNMSICLGFEWDFLFSQAQAAPGQGNGDTQCLRSKIYYYTLIHLSQKKNAGHLNTLSARCAGEMKRQNTELTGGGENEPTLPVTSQRRVA